MYDIPELEKKWRKYKKNQVKKPIIIGSVIAVLLAGSAVSIITYMKKHKEAPKHESVSKPVAVQTAPVAKNSNSQSSSAMIIQKVNKDGKPIKSANEPAQATANVVNKSNEVEIAKLNVPDDEVRVIGFDGKDKKKIKKKYEDILIPKESEKDIAEKEKIAQMEEDFKTTQDTKDSLYLARYFYKKGDYKKAESWAVQTNNIDGDIEESWLIFAKARAKQGFRTDAIKVLQSYYDETQSKKAKALLKKLRLGKYF